MLGDVDCAVAGGAESMSRGGYLLPALREGQRLGDAKAIDMVLGVLTDPFGNGHLGLTVENVAKKFAINREQQDAFAVQSHTRSVEALAEGRFDSQIVPVKVPGKKGITVFDKDEHVRLDATLEGLSVLRAAFARDGTVTAGNASGLNDGAAALVLMEEHAAKAEGRQIVGRIVAYAHSGVDPALGSGAHRSHEEGNETC